MIASIIVLNYQGERIISETIDSLLKLKFPRTDFEIIIADNNSQDNSRQIIDQYVAKYPKLIKTHYMSTNIGFGAGNNEAIKVAKGSYIILLNNDCLVSPNWLTNLVKVADSNQNIFSVTSKIKRYPKKLNQIQNVGSMIFQDGYGRDIGAIVTKDHQQLYEIDDGQFDQVKEVYSTCGAAALYRKNILDKIGLFDSNFFMYYEDTELCERARLAGYTNFYSSKAVVYRHHAASSGQWSPFFIYHVEKGRLLHLLFHFPLSVYLSEYFKFALKSKLRLLRHPKSFTKNFVYVKVAIHLFFNFPKYYFHRLSFNKTYNPNQRQQNYQKILSGYWYFN